MMARRQPKPEESARDGLQRLAQAIVSAKKAVRDAEVAVNATQAEVEVLKEQVGRREATMTDLTLARGKADEASIVLETLSHDVSRAEQEREDFEREHVHELLELQGKEAVAIALESNGWRDQSQILKARWAANQTETDRLVRVGGGSPRYDCSSDQHPYKQFLDDLGQAPDVKPYVPHWQQTHARSSEDQFVRELKRARTA